MMRATAMMMFSAALAASHLASSTGLHVPACELAADSAKARSTANTRSRSTMPLGQADADSARTLWRALQKSAGDTELHDRFVRFVRRSSLPVNASVADDGWIASRDRATELLNACYQDLATAHPRSAAVYYGWGLTFSSVEDPRARDYLLRAVSFDGSLARAHEQLWQDAERRGDVQSARMHLESAMRADSSNASYAFYLVETYAESDSASYERHAADFQSRFHSSPRAAQLRYLQATRASNDSTRRALLNSLIRDYKVAENRWASEATALLYETELRTDAGQAARLAETMITSGAPRDSLRWRKRASNAHRVQGAKNAIAQSRFDDAAQLLNDVSVEATSENSDWLTMLRAEVNAARGQARVAYDSILAKASRAPSDTLLALLHRYAAAAGKSLAEQFADLQTTRLAQARHSPSFQLAGYGQNAPFDSRSLQGKVVLLTFWFPGCGPCRAEFPFMEQVVRTLDSTRFAYVGINVAPDQDGYVQQFMTSTGYSFRPLRATDKWAFDMFGVRGEPMNFLIDGQGRIIFAGFRVTRESTRQLQLMIESLLEETKGARR